MALNKHCDVKENSVFILQMLVEKFSWTVLVSSRVANFVSSLLFVICRQHIIIIDNFGKRILFFFFFLLVKKNERMVLDYFVIGDELLNWPNSLYQRRL